MTIVTEYIQRGDSFQERIELFSAFLCHLTGTSGVVLGCEILASSFFHSEDQGGRAAHPLPLLREISPGCGNLANRCPRLLNKQ